MGIIISERDMCIKIVTNSPLAQGQKEYLSYLNGERLTLKEAILVKCYDCMGYYVDGKEDCKSPLCSLYPFMPYNPNKAKFKAESEKPAEAVNEVVEGKI